MGELSVNRNFPLLFPWKEFKSAFALCEKLSNLSSFIFHLSFLKVLYKSVLLSIIKVPYKSVLLSTITCRHLSLTYHTQKYFIKEFYHLAKRWLCVTNVTYHSQKCILSVFCYVKFPLHMWNKQHSAYMKLRLTLQSLTTLKIGELLSAANSPNLSDITIWRVIVNG